jgi:hypothetical protein
VSLVVVQYLPYTAAVQYSGLGARLPRLSSGLPLASSVTLGKFLNLSVFLFPPLRDGDKNNNSYLMG